MKLRVLAAIVLIMAAVAGCGNSDSGGDAKTQVRIAAASDLKFALEEIVTAFEAEHHNIDVTVSYGSSGTYFQQISNGAPFDLYLSADLSYPKKLVEAGKADQADVFGYAVGRLAVWVAKDSPVDPTKGLAALADREALKVAIANPEHAPYGKAAVAAMRTAGVYEAVAPKLVLGENVAQAAEFAQSGNAQAGVIALSLALSPQLKDKGRYNEVPLESFPRIDQGGVVLGAAVDPGAARSVRDHMLGTQGRAVLARYGFYEPTK